MTRFAFSLLAEDIIDEIVTTTNERIGAVAKITRNTELRWLYISRRLNIRCPTCSSPIHSNCGKFKCFKCGQSSTIKSHLIGEICRGCKSLSVECSGLASLHELPSPCVHLNKVLDRSSCKPSVRQIRIPD